MKPTILCITVALSTVIVSGCRSEDRVELSYSPEFVSLVEKGMLNRVEIVQETSGDTYIFGEAKLAGPAAPASNFVVHVPPLDHSLQGLLVRNKVQIHAVPTRSAAVWGHVMAAWPFLIALFSVAAVIIVLVPAVRLVRARGETSGKAEP